VLKGSDIDNAHYMTFALCTALLEATIPANHYDNVDILGTI